MGIRRRGARQSRILLNLPRILVVSGRITSPDCSRFRENEQKCPLTLAGFFVSCFIANAYPNHAGLHQAPASDVEVQGAEGRTMASRNQIRRLPRPGASQPRTQEGLHPQWARAISTEGLPARIVPTSIRKGSIVRPAARRQSTRHGARWAISSVTPFVSVSQTT
jgi:hypothetical protein